MQRSFGAQLYIFTKQYHIDQDIDVVLDGLVKSGYRSIEGGPMDAEIYFSKLRQRNLQLCGQHVMTSTLRDPAPIAYFMHTLQAQDINASGTLSWHDRRVQDYQEAAQVLNRAGKMLRDEGLYLHYHNHDFEFEKIDGARTGMDVLLENLDLSIVDLCVDVGFVWIMGHDPVTFLKRHAGKVSYIHLRDFSGKTSSELGRGEMPLPAIMAQLNAMPAIRHIVVEQDPVAKDPFESMAISLKYLETLSTNEDKAY